MPVDMVSNASCHKINDWTERVIYAQTYTRDMKPCKQCDMFCRITPEARQNNTIEAGQDRCDGCRWANVSLHPGPQKGISFDNWRLGEDRGSK